MVTRCTRTTIDISVVAHFYCTTNVYHQFCNCFVLFSWCLRIVYWYNICPVNFCICRNSFYRNSLVFTFTILASVLIHSGCIWRNGICYGTWPLVLVHYLCHSSSYATCRKFYTCVVWVIWTQIIVRRILIPHSLY